MSSFCIGCACSDERACIGGCAWLREDPIAQVGVCSNCPEHVERWDAGDRSLTEEAELTIEDLAAEQGFGLILPEELLEPEVEQDDRQGRLILPGDADYHL